MSEQQQQQSDHDLLVRIDERTQVLVTTVNAIKEMYVTKTEFGPVKRIVYGLISVILIAVVGAIMTLIVK